VGSFYGFALLITVAAVDTGVVSYVVALLHNWFGDSWLGSLDPTGHGTILVITLILLAIQSTVNITGARIMAIPSILAQLPSGLQDFLLLVIIFAFFPPDGNRGGHRAGPRLEA
jgi:hypothetical protein